MDRSRGIVAASALFASAAMLRVMKAMPSSLMASSTVGIERIAPLRCASSDHPPSAGYKVLGVRIRG